MKTTNDIEQELLMKEKRVSYWEKFRAIPDSDILAYYNNSGEVQI